MNKVKADVVNEFCLVRRKKINFEIKLRENMEFLSFLKKFARDRNLSIDMNDMQTNIERAEGHLLQLIYIADRLKEEVLEAYEDSFKDGGQNRGDLLQALDAEKKQKNNIGGA